MQQPEYSTWPVVAGMPDLQTEDAMRPDNGRTRAHRCTGLILSGGGARAAYQVGVLQELAAIQKASNGNLRNPYDIICGTSSGAINASVLACGADRFEETLAGLVDVWDQFRVNQVYRSDFLDMVRSGARWLSLISLGWAIRTQRVRPKSLLDNSPLAEMLRARIDFGQLAARLAGGDLQALAVTASSYTTGEHVTFYQSRRQIQPWKRNQRLAMHCTIDYPHLLASSGIPFLFPAIRLDGPGGGGWFGDGAMRQTAPIAPAIHLGAERVLVIGAGRIYEPKPARSIDSNEYPSMASIAGLALSSIFLDALAVDIERLERINKTLELIPPESRDGSDLKPVDLLVISPSERLDEIAARHVDRLPATVKKLLRILGMTKRSDPGQSGAFISYLLFESAYTRELIALGRKDTRARTAEILQFFDWV